MSEPLPPGNEPQPTPSTAPTPALDYKTPGSEMTYAGPTPDKDARMMGMLCHLLSLAGLVVPFGNVLGPLVIWLVKKDTSPFVDDQGKESLNFQITATIALLIAGATICIGIGFFLLPIVGIVALVLAIIAALKANEGVAYRYPFNIRFIK
jgi:uncharacterized Tic20 family protein